MTQIRHFVDPETVRTELKNATVGFFFDQWEREGVAIKSDCLIVCVRGTFDCNIGATGKLRSVEFGHHIVDLSSPLAAVKDARAIFAQPSLLFPTPPRRPKNRRDPRSGTRYLWQRRGSAFSKRTRFRCR